MCGVIGFRGQPSDYNLLRELLYFSKIRGLHGAGVAFYQDDDIITQKNNVGADVFIEQSWDIIEGVNMYADKGGLFRLEANIEPGDRIKEGVTLARIINFFGEEIEQIRAPCEGVIMGFKTDLCVYPGDPLLKVGKILRKLRENNASVRND